MFKYQSRTDFIDELIEINSKNEHFDQQVRNYKNIKTNHINLKKYHSSIGKPIGEYFSISFESLHDKNERENLEKVIVKNLKNLFEKYNIDDSKKVLVVGMGNQNITPDALGPKSIENLIITNHLFEDGHIKESSIVRRVCAISPGVMGTTGMETSDIIYAINKQLKPDLVICIDALATKSLKRINRAIQISDTGISPGSGIGNHRKRIDYKALKCPVITIGVATVIDSLNLFFEFISECSDILKVNLSKQKIRKVSTYLLDEEMNLIVTPKEIDEDINNLSEVISSALNIALHDNYKNL